MKNKLFSMFDYFLIAVVYVLITMGVFFIYSSSVGTDGISTSNEYLKQIIWGAVSIVIMIAFTLYDYRKFNSFFSYWLYAIVIILLILTLVIGKEVNNSKSWLGFGRISIQPAEFGKVVFIIILAKYLENSQDSNPLKRFIYAIFIMGIPFGLVLLQHDLGSALVYIAIMLIMCFFANIPTRFITFILSFGLLSIFLAVLPTYNETFHNNSIKLIQLLDTGKYRLILIAASALVTALAIIARRYYHAPKQTYWIAYIFLIITLSLIAAPIIAKVFKEHQKMRLIIFLDPYKDYGKYGYNIIQSKIAIGAGGMFGRGFLQGTQSHYKFLPEQSTDFIFSILSEEMGFTGGLIVFGAYLFILIRALIIVKQSSNKFGCFIAAGIFALFGFHFFINIGTVMGILPTIGIPLIFVSYGGSSVTAGIICIGLLMSINARRKELA